MTSNITASDSGLQRPLPPSDVVQHIAGVALTATTVPDAATAIIRAAQGLRAANGPTGLHVHLASAQTIALAAEDPRVDSAINSDGWTLPDGKPAVLISAFRHDRDRLHQTRGVDVFRAVCRRGMPTGLKHYLLGSTPETLLKMEQELLKQHPGIAIVGAASPPFRQPSDAELAERDGAIRDSGAEVVWVGLGTPKQDFEAVRLAGGLPVVAVAIGAVFDFTAGTLHLAPAWMSRFGLEWLHRLLSEPRRLWRRYTIESSKFLLAALRWGRRRRVALPR